MPSPFQRVPRLVAPSTSRCEVMARIRRIRSVQVSRVVAQRTYRPQVAQAAMSVSKTYQDTGVLSAIEDVVNDLVGFFLAHILAGVVVMAGAVCCLGPLVAIPAFVARTVVGDLVIQHKRLCDTGIDPKFKEDLLGTILLSAEEIILTNLARLNRRAFTSPNIESSVLINRLFTYGNFKNAISYRV